MTSRRFGWLCGAGAAAVVFAVSPLLGTAWALATEGTSQWPLLVALVPQGFLAYWFVGGSLARAQEAERTSRSTRPSGDWAQRRQLRRAMAGRGSNDSARELHPH